MCDQEKYVGLASMLALHDRMCFTVQYSSVYCILDVLFTDEHNIWVREILSREKGMRTL